MNLSGTAEANSTVTVYNGTSVLRPTTADRKGAWSLTAGNLAQTSHSFTERD